MRRERYIAEEHLFEIWLLSSRQSQKWPALNDRGLEKETFCIFIYICDLEQARIFDFPLNI